MARVLRKPVGGGQNQRAATGQGHGPANAGPNSAKCFWPIGGRQPKPSRQPGDDCQAAHAHCRRG